MKVSVGWLLATRSSALREDGGRRAGVTSAGGATLHHHPSGGRPGFIAVPRTCGRRPQVALASGLAELDVLVVGVADTADRRAARDVHATELARGHQQHRVVAFPRRELNRRAGRTRELTTAAGLQLDVVDLDTDRDVAQALGVAGVRLRVGARDDLSWPTSSPIGAEDVALLAVRVVEQGDEAGPVRVVLDRVATFAGTSSFSRLKSMTRYLRLLPPPR